MAIDRIPGVGPTNADIATAVAAPSAATIAAAVAAPSSETIASAVAAAGNSAGWGATGGGNRVAYVTSTSTWAHPDGYASPRKIKIIKYNGGGGGNGGCARINTSAGQYANGSSGGGSGFFEIAETFISSDLSITIGAGGAGGTGGSTSGVSSTANINGGFGAWGGTTIVTGTGVNLSTSNNTFYRHFFGISSTNDYGWGLSGGGGSFDSSITSDSIGGSNGRSGLNGGSEKNNSILGDASATANKGLAYYGSNAALAPGGGGAGAFARGNVNVGTGAVGGAHGAYSTTTGGTGGNGAIATNAALTGNAGSAGGAFGNGGGAGGGASVYSTGAAYTVTGGAGGAGGAGGVIIYY